MLARVSTVLPFFVTVFKDLDYPPHEFLLADYKIRFLKPGRTRESESLPYYCRIDGKEAYQADVLVIEFQKDQFDRKKKGPVDPDPQTLLEVSNSFIRRLRAVAKAAHASELTELRAYHIDYLNDDGSALDEEERNSGDTIHNLQRGRGPQGRQAKSVTFNAAGNERQGSCTSHLSEAASWPSDHEPTVRHQTASWRGRFNSRFALRGRCRRLCHGDRSDDQNERRGHGYRTL